MDPVIQNAFAACQRGQGYAFATIVENTLQGTARKSGAKMIVFKDGTTTGTIGGGLYEKSAIRECLKAIKTNQPNLVTYESFGKKGQGICGGKFSVFIEPCAEIRHLIICGAGHIGLSLSLLAKFLNFKVTVIDSRKEFAKTKRFPHVDAVKLGNPRSLLRNLPINQNTYLVIVTHSHESDFSCLTATLNSSAAYLGMIGSQAKRSAFLKKLNSTHKQAPTTLSLPAGLDIGAQTPEEIALSIMAEIISEYNKRWKNTAKFRAKTQGT